MARLFFALMLLSALMGRFSLVGVWLCLAVLSVFGWLVFGPSKRWQWL